MRLQRALVHPATLLLLVCIAITAPATAASAPRPYTSDGRYTPVGVLVAGSSTYQVTEYTPARTAGGVANDVLMLRSGHANTKVVVGRVGRLQSAVPQRADRPLPEAFKYFNDTAADRRGAIYIAGNGVVAKVRKGRFTLIAGKLKKNGDPVLGKPQTGRAVDSRLGYDLHLATDSAANLYIADRENDVVEKVTPSGRLSIFAGRIGDKTSDPDPAQGTNSPVPLPSDVAVDGDDNVWVAVGGQSVTRGLPSHNQVLRFASDGSMVVMAGRGGYGHPKFGRPATKSYLGIEPRIEVAPNGRLTITIASDVWTDDDFAMIAQVDGAGNLVRIAGRKNGTGRTRSGPATERFVSDPLSPTFTGGGLLLFISDYALAQVGRGGKLTVKQREVKKNWA